METSVAGVTVSEAVADMLPDAAASEAELGAAVPDMLPDVAVIKAEPAATAATRPLEPAVLLMVAIEKSEEPHVTREVMSCVVLSENVPVAVNC